MSARDATISARVRAGQHPHLPNAGRSVEWYTPPEVFDAIGLRFDLDPCAPVLPEADWLPVDRRISLPADGLAADWAGRVWLNPPYGRAAGAWVQKLAEHGNGIALVFARTDVAWWHRAVPTADAVCFIDGRLTFRRPQGEPPAPGNSGGPSALIAWGDDCARALESCGLGITYAAASSPEERPTNG